MTRSKKVDFLKSTFFYAVRFEMVTFSKPGNQFEFEWEWECWRRENLWTYNHYLRLLINSFPRWIVVSPMSRK